MRRLISIDQKNEKNQNSKWMNNQHPFIYIINAVDNSKVDCELPAGLLKETKLKWKI